MAHWKSASYSSLSPYLICVDAEGLLAFIESAFDGSVLRRFDRADGSLMHAEIKIDDSIVMVGGGTSGIADAPAHLHLYAEDAVATFDRAVQAGRSVVREIEQADDGDLRGGVRDPWGSVWWIDTQQPRE